MVYLAFDIGGTNIKYAAITEKGEILIKGKYKSPKNSLEELIHSMGEVHRELAVTYNFEGIALSIPGAPNNETGVVPGGSALPFIHGPNLREALLKETGLNMFAENDAKSAALCEVWIGAASDVQDSLFIVLGTGVGGAIVKNKKLHYGRNHLAGEFGYLIQGYDFERSVFTTFSSLGSTGSLVLDVARRRSISPDHISGEEIFLDAENGDRDCIQAIERFYESIATAIYGLMYTYNPEKIILGGAISARPDLPIRISEKLDEIKKNITSDIPEVNPPIVPCQYGEDANLLGAVYNYMTNFECF